MSRLALLLLCAVLALPLFAADNEPPPGFISLFNGKDLTGWNIPEGDNGHWKVVDGVIDYDAQSEAKGKKDLMSVPEFSNFTLMVDWRIKEAPYVNPNVYYVLPDGNEAKDPFGKPLKLSLPDSDSGIIIRGDVAYQVNIWCWPIGSGEMYGVRKNAKMPPEAKAGATPRTQADNPVGQWNRFEITVKDSTVTVMLNGKLVIPEYTVPGLPAKGSVGLQHHGAMKEGKYTSPPALLQFKNIFIKELK
ncbi:MAG TPA: DUF1080 domain-containing protein [Planctomycetota bacterium]|nr:DUF1080 domain-containing protein [Planctomycetota bacterium]